jgi:hypothetical protein
MANIYSGQACNTDAPGLEKLVTDIAGHRTTMELHAFPKDHLLDQIIRQSRQWVERREEEAEDNGD